MDYIYINLERIPSYAKINEIFEKVEYINVLKYKYDSIILEEFDKSVLKHIIYLEEKIYSCHKDESREIIELIPILNLKKIKEVEPVFSQIDRKYKKEIFSYIYWKYKNKCSKEKVNILNLKKIMGLKGSKEEYIIPVEVKIKCPKCTGKAIIYFYNYDYNHTSYKCFNCQHREKSVGIRMRDENFYTLLKCNCNNCSNIKKELKDTIKNNLKTLISDVNSKLLSDYLEIEDILPPTEYTMKKDFKLYLSNLSKDEREILSFKPKNKEELLKIIHDIESRDSIYSKKYNNVIKKLKEHKVIYYTKNKIINDNIKNKLYELVIRHSVKIKVDNYEISNVTKKIEYLNKLYSYLDKATLHEFLEIYRGYLEFEIEDICIYYNTNFTIELDSIIFFIEDYIINNNYICNQNNIVSSNKHLVENGLIKKLFKSNAEMNYFRILKNKYENAIIIPNYQFSQICNLNPLIPFFTDNEIKYLKTCIIDIVMCDNEGIPFKLIEIQKGDHHNNSEWIKKDGIKKRACNIIGIQFEELF